MDFEGNIQLVKQLRKRNEALKEDYNRYRSLWGDIRDFLGPRTARFEGELVNDGTREDTNIINTSPRFAVRTLPAGMQSGITNPARPWFQLGTPDPDLEQFESVKIWLWEVQQRMLTIMARSNLYDQLKANYSTLGLYGTSVFFMEEDTQDVVRGYDFQMGTWRLASDERRRVNTMYRDVNMSAIQAVAKFGLDRVPQHIRTAYDTGNYEQRFDVVHIVEPNRLFDSRSLFSRGKPWASIWLNPSDEKADAILAYSGYDYKPFMAPRWETVGDNDYGMGCGEIALGDAKQIQFGEKRGLQILDKISSPTMVADSSLRGQRKTNLPGDTTYVNGLLNGQDGYRPAYQINNPPLQAVEEKQRQVEQRIDEAFYKNLFLLIAEIGDQPGITATQINTMREEKLLMLGPVLERLNGELLNPVITALYDIMDKRGLIPPAPPELEGVPLRIEYISIMAQAQKVLGIGNIERMAGFIGQIAQFDQSALDKLNTDETIDSYADSISAPPKITRTTDEANEIRAQRAEAQAQAAQLENANALAQTAKTLSDANLSDDNALARAVDVATT